MKLINDFAQYIVHNNMLFVLSGLVFEIIGTFILAADAIGLDRFHKWIDILSLIKENFNKKGGVDNSKIGVYKIILSFIITMSSVAIALSITFKLESIYHIKYLRYFISIIIGLSVVLIFMILIKSVIITLKKIEKKTRERTIGIIGFLFLFLGFCLQFVGTLIDFVTK